MTDVARESIFRRLYRRLTTTDEELQDDERRKAAKAEGAQAVCDCRDREYVHLVGVLLTVTINPPGDHHWFEADLTDGSGHVRLVWMGRRSIRGVDAGRRIRVEGRLSYVDGVRTLYNPRYELLA